MSVLYVNYDLTDYASQSLFNKDAARVLMAAHFDKQIPANVQNVSKTWHVHMRNRARCNKL